MKLSMFPIVKRTIATRDQLEQLIAEVEIGRLQVSIAAQVQDEAMIALVKPVVLRELKGRLASLDRDLEAYGVQVKEPAPIKGQGK